MEKRILVISWFYPPVNSSEGLVTYKLLKSSKYQYDVFTQKNNALWSYGNKNDFPSNSNVKTIFAKADNLEDWMKEAIEYYHKNRGKYDIIMTRSMPPESHEVGLKIKKIDPHIIWFASFGDPIANNPFTKISITYESPYKVAHCRNILGVISPKRILKNTLFKMRYRRLHKTYLEKDLKFQEQIFEKANYLIFNSEYQRDYMLSTYRKEIKEKVLILYHSFDHELYPKIKSKNSDKIKMSYIGHLDSIRNPFILFSAIRDLYLQDKKLDEKVVFEFYGNMSDQDKLFIINNELTDIIKVKKPVSYLDSLKIMRESDWLLQIDANIVSVCDKNIFFAAKIADYIGAGNKIFGITMIEGISADILRGLNAIVTSYSSEEVKNYLWLIIYQGYTVNMNEEYRKQFDSIEVAQKFDDFIANKVLKNN